MESSRAYTPAGDPASEAGSGCWTNLISLSRAVQDQGHDQFALGLAITCDVTRVRLYVRNEFGGLSEECVSTDPACVGGRNVDEPTGGLAAEWA